MTTRTVVRVVLAALLTTLAVLLVLWVLYRLQTVVVWSILALFLTIGLEPAVDWLAVRRVPRALAILAVYVGLVVILAGILAVAVPALVHQGSALVRRLQDLGGVGAAAGTTLHAGDRLALRFSSANRDGARFQRPDELVLDRGDNPHVTFGHGIHRCVGAQFARIQLTIAFEELLARTTRFRLKEGAPIPRHAGVPLGSPAALHLVFDRR